MSHSHHPHDIRSVGLEVKMLHAHSPDSNLSTLDTHVHHKICALAHYSDEVDQQLFSFVDIEVQSRRGHGIHRTSIDTLGSWITSGETTDMSLTDLGRGEVLIGIASGSGALHLLRLLLPQVPGVRAADIQILDLNALDQKLVPWATPHKAACSSIDIQGGQGNSAVVLSSSLDGSLSVMDVQESYPTSAPLFKAPGTMSYASFAAAKWAGVHSIVALSSSGQVDLYDTRKGGSKPSSCAPCDWGVSGPSHGEGLPLAARNSLPRCLTIHPSRPDLAAIGCSDGLVALWDLRMHTTPLASALPMAVGGVRGGVTEVLFDPLAPSSTPSFVFSTEDGSLAQATGAGGNLALSVLHEARSAINGFDLAGTDAVFVSDNQELVYIKRQ